MLTTGQKIIRARLLLGAWADPPRDVSQTDLAQWIGVTQGSVGHWETDRRRPDADSYSALARILGVRLDWFMRDLGPMYEGDASRPSVQPPPKPKEAQQVSPETQELDIRKAENLPPKQRTRPAKPSGGKSAGRGKRGE
jgi:transcriptional regulator with XRE-family HTH domain